MDYDNEDAYGVNKGTNEPSFGAFACIILVIVIFVVLF